jgi:serine O-acetyltransferase
MGVMSDAPKHQEHASIHQAVSAEAINKAALSIGQSIEADPASEHLFSPRLPDRDRILKVLDQLRWMLFPGFFGPRDFGPEGLHDHLKNLLEHISVDFQAQVEAALRYEETLDGNTGSERCSARAIEIVQTMFERLPEIRRLLSLDMQAAFDGDPAARHTDETILCYPGLYAISVHRIAHELFLMGVPLIPRIMSEEAHSKTGIDIHPGAQIGERFFVDHGTGVVIGETAEIGSNCKLYQGVTIGATAFLRDESGRLKRGIKRHPTLKDNVTVFAGASILGGATVIGEGSVINGGVFLTHSVPPEHIVRAPKADVRLRSAPGSKARKS